MSWTVLDTWIALAGVLAACACALPGTYLVVRRMSMMGDAVSHAVLPGLVVAFLLTGSRAGPVMLAGAVVVGVLTALLTQMIHRLGHVDRDAAMGVVFTSLFALGLVLIVRAAEADHVDLDPGCVLYGAIETVPLDQVSLGPWRIPRAMATLLLAYAINLACVAFLYKELAITAFDPALADAMGIPSGLLTYLLMSLVAMTAVAAFEIAGSILVIAMLVVPPVTALCLSDSLGRVLVLGQLIAAASAVVGHVAAVSLPRLAGFGSTSTSGMIAVAAGGFLALAVLFAPTKGAVPQWLHRLQLARQVLCEDLLGYLFRAEELAGLGRTRRTHELARAVQGGLIAVRLALAELARTGAVVAGPGGWRLAEPGRDRARRLVRSHRLWGAFLAAELGVRADHVHGTAHRLEHLRALDPVLERETSSEIAEDPHGRPIPPAL